MKYLAYTTYCSGRSGLSNGIMSLEIGLILAHLTNRLLVLEGNESPPANVVQYPGLVSNRYPSKLTDLIHLPHPWCEAQDIDLTPFDSKEWTSHSLGKCVFSHPAGWEAGRKDFQCFAHGRQHRLAYTDDYAAATVLKMSGGPGVGPHQYKMWNFSFYSYFFYLDPPHHQQMFDLLKRMTPKKPYRDLADRVVSDLGPFNAVHIRRGDFKKTFGVTTLDRTPQEALEVLQYHFSSHEKLVILTDEQQDPFFHEIVASYPDCVFLDQFILDHHREAFLDLPQHDSIALAFLSQLIAGKAQDFIGSMNSTFTSLIQRIRGNAGRVEPFKFLWNELPDEGVHLQRGRHAASRCVPMNHGVMIEQYSGPYSWNRVHPRINPAWMREWPESFIPGYAGTQTEHDTYQEHVPTTSTDYAALSAHMRNQIGQFKTQKLLELQGEAISKDGKAVVFIGKAEKNTIRLIENLRSEGWISVSTRGITLNISSKEVMPQCGGRSSPLPCEALVLVSKTPGPQDQLVPGSPAKAVGTILSHCGSFPDNRESTTRALCEFVELIPVYLLTFADGRQAVKLMREIHHDQTFHHVSPGVIREQNATEGSEASKAHTDAVDIIPSASIQIDEFLSPDDVRRLLSFTLNQESTWEVSTVSNAAGSGARAAPEYRKSIVLKSFRNSEFADLIVKRVQAHLSNILQELHITSYAVKEIEAQLTASNDGDFFGIHNDNSSRGNKARELTYVYYFYRAPKRFIGGELVIYDGKIEGNAYVRADSFKVIEPRHNSIVFFPSGCLHEVLPIRCPSQAFGDSRFTINGWVQRQRMLPPTGLPDSIKEWAQSFK